MNLPTTLNRPAHACGCTDAGDWPPRRRAFPLPSLVIGPLSLALVLTPEPRQSPGWVQHITLLWGLLAALVVGLPGRLQVRGDGRWVQPRFIGVVGGLVVLTVGVGEWPGGV